MGRFTCFFAFKDIFKNTELMFDQSVKSSVITARLAATHLKEYGVNGGREEVMILQLIVISTRGGSLTLTGAAAATGATPCE